MPRKRKRKAAKGVKAGCGDGDGGSLTLEEVKERLDGDSCCIVVSYLEHKWADERMITWHHPTDDMLIFLRRIGYKCNPCLYSRLLPNVAQECNLDRLKLVLSISYCDQNAIDEFAEVCCCGHLPSVKYLVERYGIKDVLANRTCALSRACSRGHLDVVQYLVTHVKARDPFNQSLVCASRNGHIDVVKYLVETFRLTVEDVSRRYIEESAFAAACKGFNETGSQSHPSVGPHNQTPNWKRSDQLGVVRYYTDTFKVPRQCLSSLRGRACVGTDCWIEYNTWSATLTYPETNRFRIGCPTAFL